MQAWVKVGLAEAEKLATKKLPSVVLELIVLQAFEKEDAETGNGGARCVQSYHTCMRGRPGATASHRRWHRDLENPSRKKEATNLTCSSTASTIAAVRGEEYSVRVLELTQTRCDASHEVVGLMMTRSHAYHHARPCSRKILPQYTVMLCKSGAQ